MAAVTAPSPDWLDYIAGRREPSPPGRQQRNPVPDTVKQITLRLPDELHATLKAAAKASRRSLHAEILWRLERRR
jgi:predicted HicB family RNase H-like nuclease